MSEMFFSRPQGSHVHIEKGEENGEREEFFQLQLSDLPRLPT